MGNKAVKLIIPAGEMQRDFTEKADGCQRMVFFFLSIYDALEELLRGSRFRDKQYTDEMCYTAGQGRKRLYGAINRGKMFEICQGYAGPDNSPLPVFLSSDTTVICKSMAAHPIISEFTTCFCHILPSEYAHI